MVSLTKGVPQSQEDEKERWHSPSGEKGGVGVPALFLTLPLPLIGPIGSPQ
jgi:hypothetical protein